MKKLSKIIARVCATSMATIMLFTAAGCGTSAKNVNSVKFAKSEEKTISSYSEEGYHLMTDNLKLVAKSGLIELYWDEASCAVAVKETSQNHLWYSLPKEPNGRETNPAAVVSIEAVRGNEKYVLNSQDNAVKFGTAKYVTSDNGVTVEYTIATDEKTARTDKKSRLADDVAFDIAVRYELKDGSLFVSIDCKNLAESSAKITKIGLMEYFGAGVAADASDFILLPDGCGSMLYPEAEKENEKTKNLKFNVYGSDLSVPSNDENSYDSVIPAYGMKQGNSAFAVLIQKGDAIASVNASNVAGDSGYYKVGANFAVTPISSTQDKKENINQYVANETYSGKLQLCYRFLSGNHADVSGMALACREQLIRDAVLSTKQVETENEKLPLFVSVIGEYPHGKRQSSREQKLTTFDQALDMILQMKAKGIDNVNVRYRGALSGGFDSNPLYSAKLLRSLGGKKDFENLYNEMSKQTLSLYLDIPLVSSGTDKTFSGGKSAVSIFGDRTSATQKNFLFDNAGPENFTYNFMDLSSLEEYTRDWMIYSKKFEISGYCISDAGKYLYSSFGKHYSDRQSSAERLTAQSESLSTNRRIMIDTGNFYMLKNADEVVNLPLSTTVEESAGYKSTPFVQMLLHGTLDYAGTPINYNENDEARMLRSIEYGACPSFEWCYEELSGAYYGDSLNRAAEYYARANDTLGDLRSSRMTNHYEVSGAPGVYCTEYGTGSLVYVNYNDNEVSVNGVTIPARDFLRIN